MRLADFILHNMEIILGEWEAFARTLLPAAAGMTSLALRDDAKHIWRPWPKICQRPRRRKLRPKNPRAEQPNLQEPRRQQHKPTRWSGRVAALTLTNWPLSTALCGPASFACGWTSASLVRLTLMMSSVSTRPSIRRSSNQSAYSVPK